MQIICRNNLQLHLQLILKRFEINFLFKFTPCKALNNVELGGLRVARTLNTISPSEIFRLKLASVLLKKPDLLLVNNASLENVTSTDLQLLSQILKANPTNSTVVINAYDEDFLQNTVSSVLEVGAIDVPTTYAQGQTYAAAKTLSAEKKVQLNAAAAGKIGYFVI